MTDTFKPTAKMAANAEKGLKLRKDSAVGARTWASNVPNSLLRGSRCPPKT
ncbi:hypothetical protein QFZ54_001140 [Sphingomonas faeni]|nr:hypothetical protein [Sphingomonas faeni]